MAYFDLSTNPSNVMLMLGYIDPRCVEPCMVSETFDLGPGRARRGLSVAIDGPWAHAAWLYGGGMRHKRVHLDRDHGALDIRPRPTQTIVDSAYAENPHLAADGTDVTLAYGFRGDTRIRHSDDRGRTFSGKEIIYQPPCRDCGAGSRPLSIDMLDGYTLVEFIAGGTGFDAIGVLSHDDFETWSETSSPSGSHQVGALLYDGTEPTLAEARDNNALTPPGTSPDTQRIRFRTGLIP